MVSPATIAIVMVIVDVEFATPWFVEVPHALPFLTVAIQG